MNLFKGVYEDKLKNGSKNYRASITVNGKHISLGSFDDPDKAHNAYEYASKLLNDTSISISDYDEGNYLSSDKFVSIINLRDNNIYFKTPVYLHKTYFSYFYSQNVELKFDMDDLFYISSHKIMKRNNHFFMADFGLQESLNERYGIRSFAVLNKDYRFINGDRLDYRRENIEIINRYYGVRKLDDSSYISCINATGRLKIGIYETEIEAALAYNKAADTLKANGVNKEFILNYIEDLSPRDYATIYSNVKIGDNIINYRGNNAKE